uniref:BTB/POZ domain-containing protein 16 n=1 Tax=Callorhinchus milii TaxID=7868 RepID=A0A4W3HES4_CALMI
STDVVLQCLDSFWELHSQYLLKSKLLLELLTTNVTEILLCLYTEPVLCSSILYFVGIAFAVALGNLYNAELEVDVKYAVSVLTAASILKFPTLFQKCVSVMMNNINSTTVCHFLTAALKYNLDLLMHDCERWLELNLTVHLRYEANFRDLQLDFLHKILLSPRLFTFSEYHVLQTVLCWIFLQMNPKVRIMPSYNGILTYFISLPKTSVFLEKEIGERFLALFKALRLHGITESKYCMFVELLIFKCQTVLLHSLLWNVACHFKPSPDFRRADRIAWREYQKYLAYSNILIFIIICDCSLYSSLPFRICERYAFSLRQEREIQYAIQVQSLVDERWQVFNSGKQTQKFGVTKKTCHSQVLMIAGLTMPIFVTFALLFPAS